MQKIKQKSLFLQWGKGTDGVTAVEFSLVAFPFLLMVIGIIELALMFAAANILEGAVGDATRIIRTGQVQQSGSGEQMFQDALCNHAAALINCANVQYNVVELSSFSDADNQQNQFDENGNMINSQFSPSGSSTVVMVRVSYLYPLITPLIGNFFADQPDNKRLLVSTAVFEVEPYQFTP